MRVSVSDLESFRRYRKDGEMSLDELLRRFRREDGPTEAMQAGSALHAFLETATPGSAFRVESCGFAFNVLGDITLPLTALHELSGRREYATPSGVVTLSGRVDGMTGNAIEDHKLSRQFDAQRYHDSIQWRAYLSIFSADRMTYNVFVGEKADEDGAELVTWEIKDSHRISFFRYPELETDLLRELDLYADFAQQFLNAA